MGLAKLSDDQIKEKVDLSVKRIAGHLNSKISTFLSWYVLYREQGMFNISADPQGQFRLGDQYFRSDPDHVQEVALDHMRQRYGFDENVVRKTEVQKYTERSGKETTHYPSKTVKGLEFVRTKFFYSDTNKPYTIIWGVSTYKPRSKPTV